MINNTYIFRDKVTEICDIIDNFILGNKSDQEDIHKV